MTIYWRNLDSRLRGNDIPGSHNLHLKSWSGRTGRLMETCSVPIATLFLILLNVLGYVNRDLAMCNAFRHSSLNHLSDNMAGLLIFGGYLEMTCGWRRFLSGYFLCLLGSKALWLVMDGRPSIGSSSAVYGLMGMALCIYYYRHEAEIKRALMNFLMKVDTQQRAMLTFAYLVMFLDVIIPQPNVAGWAHAGGFFTGLILSGLMVIPSASYGQLQNVSSDPREEISS